VALQLPANNLTGNFSVLTQSSSSSLASTLLFINVSGNPQLAGSIGHGIGAFQQLQGLTASSCQLSGQLPSYLANLSSLATLELSSNALAGTIPPSILQAQRLRILQLDSNQLSGSVPLQELLSMPSLQRFSIRGNHLTGPLHLPNASLLQPLQPDGDANSAVASITARSPPWHASLDDLDLGKNLVSSIMR
jgi:Leucine-rich repeat (LRR) protein